MRERLTWTLIGALLLTLTAYGAERVVIEGILVRVNERIVTISDFTDRIRQELAQMPAQPDNEQLQQFVEMLLDEMVSELVILERAQEKRVTVDEEMVEDAINNLREENGLEDDRAWEEALASAGMTEDTLRERYRRSMLMQRTVQGEVRPVEITEEELRQEYERKKEMYRVPAKVDLEQVYLADDGSDTTEIVRRARGIVERVRDGADLRAEATLAGSELQVLGEIPVEDCRPELRSALERIDDGGLTDPLIIPGGVQIVHLVRRVPAGYQPFEEVVESIRRERSAESYESQTRGLVDKLRSQYLVEVHEEYIDIIYANLGGA